MAAELPYEEGVEDLDMCIICMCIGGGVWKLAEVHALSPISKDRMMSLELSSFHEAAQHTGNRNESIPYHPGVLQ